MVAATFGQPSVAGPLHNFSIELSSPSHHYTITVESLRDCLNWISFSQSERKRVAGIVARGWLALADDHRGWLVPLRHHH